MELRKKVATGLGTLAVLGASVFAGGFASGNYYQALETKRVSDELSGEVRSLRDKLEDYRVTTPEAEVWISPNGTFMKSDRNGDREISQEVYIDARTRDYSESK